MPDAERMVQPCKEIYAIRNKETGEFIKFGVKCAWATSGAAKSAWQLHMTKWSERTAGAFNRQDTYEIVNLSQAYHRLKDLEK